MPGCRDTTFKGRPIATILRMMYDPDFRHRLGQFITNPLGFVLTSIIDDNDFPLHRDPLQDHSRGLDCLRNITLLVISGKDNGKAIDESFHELQTLDGGFRNILVQLMTESLADKVIFF